MFGLGLHIAPRMIRRSGFLVLLVLLAAIVTGQAASAQNFDCDEVIDRMAGAIDPLTCQTIPNGTACYGSIDVRAAPSDVADLFLLPGDRAPITDFDRIDTAAPYGAALLVAQTQGDPVTIILFGAAQLTPNSVGNYTLRERGGELVCEKTPSGMLIQTPDGDQGAITVNGVEIEVGSTVFITVEGDMLFDQDPRIDRRRGERNPDAPLCSGFDSDCNFANCTTGQRLVWGPYCREDAYPNIQPGLYRVWLYGSGRVRAGATDYGIERDRFSFGSQDLTLPGNYTFCWPGREPGGTGFETIVEPLSSGARIDRISLQYLGENCSSSARSASASGGVNMMTLYNIEGNVTASADVGFAAPDSGEMVAIMYGNGEATEMRSPQSADQLMASPLIQWLTFDEQGLPAVRPVGGDDVGEPSRRAPAAEFGRIGVSRNANVEDRGLVIEVEAYSPDDARGDDDGIDSVTFRIIGPDGNEVFDNTESTADYCAFGGNGPCEIFDFTENDNRWPGGSRMETGRHIIRATVRADNGRTTDLETFIFIRPAATDDEGPDISGISTEPRSLGRNFCPWDEIQVYFRADDPAGVADVSLRYRYLADGASRVVARDLSPTTVSGGYRVDLGAFEPGRLAFAILAEDEAGNSSVTRSYFIDIVDCIE